MIQNSAPHIAMLGTPAEIGPSWAPQGQGQRESNILALANAGIRPVILPYIEGDLSITDDLERYDGFYLPGGIDIDPGIYGSQPLRRGDHVDDIMSPRYNKPRDRAEMDLLQRAVAIGMPVLGICRGQQLMVVAFGGTLFPDIDAEFGDQPGYSNIHIGPDNEQWHEPRNLVTIEKSSKLAGMLGEEALVGCWHHQAADKVPDNLRVIAKAVDQMVEAVEIEGSPFGIGLQWHEEMRLASKVFAQFAIEAALFAEQKNRVFSMNA